MSRHRCRKLPSKLLAIREKLALTPAQLIDRLDIEEGLSESDIASYETGKTEPPLLVLLAYAKLAGLCTDLLIDDSRRLPKKLSAGMEC